MSSVTQDSNEICENNNVVVPPQLSIDIPRRRDIGKLRTDWASVEPELPIDILLVTVKDHEFVNCYYYLQNKKRSWCPGLGMVDIGTFGDGGVKAALITCEKGAIEPNASLIVVKNAVEILKPKAVICVGYCGLINPEKVKLGDVVISAKLGSLTPKRITADGTQQFRGFTTHVSKNMGQLIPYAEDGWEPPLKEPDSLDVKVHRKGAVMLSGSEVVNNFEKRQELLRQYPDALAVEMEGEGLYAAAYDLGIEWVVVKGVSDFADGSKTQTGNWQPFASAMAASVVHNMFSYYDVIQSWPNYKKTVQGAMSTEVTPAPNNSPTPSLPIGQFLESITGAKKDRKMYNGRAIEYSVSGRIHSLKELWVYDATAKDVASGMIVEKKHFKTAELAINGAIEELVKRLEEQKIILD